MYFRYQNGVVALIEASEKGYTVKSQFHFTAGVKKHAPVRLSGVDVGEVRAINLLYGDETLIEVVMRLNEGVKLRTDATAYVTTLGLMGEKYIELKPGTSAAPWAQEGSKLTAARKKRGAWNTSQNAARSTWKGLAES